MTATAEKEKDQKKPIAQLDNQILVDPATGQIYMKGRVLELCVPVMVVRHGQTDGNLRNVLQGQADGPENQLNRAGKQQAKQTARNLFAELVKRIGRSSLQALARTDKIALLSSPISRARDTAQFFIDYFYDRTGILLKENREEALKEMSFGRLDGSSLEDLQKDAHKKLVVKYRTTQDATIRWDDTGESFIDACVRAKHLLQRLNAERRGQVVIAFSHGTFISALRTVVGDRTLVRANGMIAFRDHIPENAVPHWLGDSHELIREIL